MAITIENNIRSDNCPLCHSKDIYFTGALLKYSTPLYFSSEEIRLEEDPEMYRCRSCDSGFIQNIISESDFHSLYEKGNSAAVWSNTPFDDDKTKQVKSELQKLFFQGASVLDVGCNVGMLLDYCKQSGCRTAGVELSESSRLILQQKQHSVYSTIESISEKFDIIFLDYVLPEKNADRILPFIYEKNPEARIVMISGWNGSPVKKAAIEKNIDAWIDKPFNVDAILSQISMIK